MKPILPITVVGGYLGAGKTTLINHLLRHNNGLRLAVLVNEFGALPIDADLIENTDGNLISIAGGCICCSFGDSLGTALMDVDRLDPRPEHILIEASGVAIPGSIAATVDLYQNMQTSGVVVLADCETILTHAASEYIGDTITRQLCDAGLIVLTKSDLICDLALNNVENWMHQSAKGASIVKAVQGQVPADVVLGPNHISTNTAPQHRADALFESQAYSAVIPLDAHSLAVALASEHFGLIRAKGCVVDTNGQSHVIQVVGRRWNVSDAPNNMKPGLVCIGLRGRFPSQKLTDLMDGVLSPIRLT